MPDVVSEFAAEKGISYAEAKSTLEGTLGEIERGGLSALESMSKSPSTDHYSSWSDAMEAISNIDAAISYGVQEGRISRSEADSMKGQVDTISNNYGAMSLFTPDVQISGTSPFSRDATSKNQPADFNYYDAVDSNAINSYNNSFSAPAMPNAWTAEDSKGFGIHSPVEKSYAMADARQSSNVSMQQSRSAMSDPANYGFSSAIGYGISPWSKTDQTVADLAAKAKENYEKALNDPYALDQDIARLQALYEMEDFLSRSHFEAKARDQYNPTKGSSFYSINPVDESFLGATMPGVLSAYKGIPINYDFFASYVNPSRALTQDTTNRTDRTPFSSRALNELEKSMAPQTLNEYMTGQLSKSRTNNTSMRDTNTFYGGRSPYSFSSFSSLNSINPANFSNTFGSNATAFANNAASATGRATNEAGSGWGAGWAGMGVGPASEAFSGSNSGGWNSGSGRSESNTGYSGSSSSTGGYSGNSNTGSNSSGSSGSKGGGTSSGGFASGSVGSNPGNNSGGAGTVGNNGMFGGGV